MLFNNFYAVSYLVYSEYDWWLCYRYNISLENRKTIHDQCLVFSNPPTHPPKVKSNIWSIWNPLSHATVQQYESFESGGRFIAHTVRFDLIVPDGDIIIVHGRKRRGHTCASMEYSDIVGNIITTT